MTPAELRTIAFKTSMISAIVPKAFMINAIIRKAIVTNMYLLYAQFEDIVSKTIVKNANIFKAIMLYAQHLLYDLLKAT